MTLFHGAASNGKKVDTRTMRFRATLASVLTVILLSISSAASNCEIKCDLGSLAPSCHGSKAPLRAQHGSMPAMDVMTHDAAGESSVTETPTVVAQAATCRTHDCFQQPSLFVEQKIAVAQSPSSLGSVIPVELQFVPEPAVTEFLGRGPPPYRPSTPVSLRTTLRV